MARANLSRMTSFARACVGLLALGSALAFAGCGDDDDAAPGGGGSAAQGGEGPDHGGESSVGAATGVAECQVVGELCHEADTGAGAAHECHELGHVNDQDLCAAEFTHCATICLAAREELEHGVGGSGAGGEHGHGEGGGAGTGGAATGGAP